MKTKTAVIGAGIVGVCAAMSLQASGHAVTVFDKSGAGEATSRWNAGVLATSSLIPLNNPRIFSKLPALLAGRHPGFQMNPHAIISTIPWALRFLYAARASRCDQSIQALRALIGHSRVCHDNLCCDASQPILDTSGWLMLFRGTRRLERAQAQQVLLTQHDVASEVLDETKLNQMEPAIGGGPFTALHLTKSAFTTPQTLIKHYVDHATNLGVRFVLNQPVEVQTGQNGPLVGAKGGKQQPFQYVVIATGAWTNELLKTLGCKLPMVVERGYLQSFATDLENIPRRPFFDVDRGYVAAPRDGRVQISTGTELTTLNTPTNDKQLRRAVEHARGVLRIGEREHSETAVGNRPTLPDSLPVIGPLAASPGVWLACGHQHIGLSTSAGTGDVLAALINGATPAIDVQPYSPARFGL